MGAWLLGAVTVAYLGVSVDYYRNGNPFDAVVFAGYALANVGFLWRMLS